MYICICQGVTDHQIRAAVQDGAQSLREVREQLHVARQCGKCGLAAQRVVHDTLAEMLSSNPDLFYAAG
ncbi:MAG: (2Fe-2S)-binding protein [Gammaproteobacteria bacterium]|nr:MAG: (2Fe-2S)-binding protein [Gammaproteobacteria bacterium]